MANHLKNTADTAISKATKTSGSIKFFLFPRPFNANIGVFMTIKKETNKI